MTRFIINKSRRWCCIEIPRCGCTTIKTLAYMDAHGGKKPTGNIHHTLGRTAESSGGIVVPSSDPIPDGYRGFVVWRDPLSRIVSLWRGFVLADTDHDMFPHMRGAPFDELAAWIADMLLKYGDRANIHFRRQIDFHRAAHRIDDVVPLDRLTEYMAREHGHDTESIGHMASSSEVQSDLQVTACGASIIGSLYVGDALIPYRRTMWRG